MTDARETAPLPLHLVGISHHSASLDVLEKLALAPNEIAAFYEKAEHSPTIRDVMILSTCNRTEVYALGEPQSGDTVATEVLGLLSDVAGSERLPTPEQLYMHSGRNSFNHLCRVACGLDSVVLGEAQILGQVKNAYDIRRQRRDVNHDFDAYIQAALKVARKSRTQTEIGRGAVSIASAAVHLATRIYADLSTYNVLVIGAGDTGKLVAEHFQNHHPKKLWITNRTFDRAVKVARAVDAEAAPIESMGELLAQADIVAAAVSVNEPIITRELLSTFLPKRSGRPLALLDLGLPRNIAPAAGSLANVFLHDIESLKKVVDANLSRRRKEVPRVEALIEGAIDRLLAGHRETAVGPLIATLRDNMERIRRIEVERACGKLSAQEKEAVNIATRAVVNKLLHGPTTSIKQFARQQEEGAERLQIIGEIFRNLKDEGDA